MISNSDDRVQLMVIELHVDVHSVFILLQSIPLAKVMWSYRGTYINNGSTLINDVDMRHYFHVETQPEAEVVRSELFLASGARLEDNGTFACVAENKAGRARAEFLLHVVVPMPPKPPQVRVYSVYLSTLS